MQKHEIPVQSVSYKAIEPAQVKVVKDKKGDSKSIQLNAGFYILLFFPDEKHQAAGLSIIHLTFNPLSHNPDI